MNEQHQQEGPTQVHYVDEYSIDPCETETVPINGQKKKRKRRTAKASDVETFINLFKSYVGTGILCLPYAVNHAGIVLSSVSMTLLCLLNHYCVMAVIDIKLKLGDEHKLHTYKDIGRLAAGSVGSYMVSASLVLSQMGFCTGYLIFVSQNLNSIASDLHHHTYLLFVLPIVLGLSWIRNVKHLTPASTLGSVSMVIAIGILLGFGFADPTLPKEPLGFNFYQFPVFLGVAIYSFEGAPLAVPIQDSMQKPHHFEDLMRKTMFIVCSMFIFFGGAGYLLFGNTVACNMTLSLPENAWSYLVKALLCSVLIMTYPLQLFPVSQMAEAFCRDRGIVLAIWQEMLLRGCLVGITAFAAISVPDFGLFLALLGSLCCGLLGFILPPYFHMSLFRSELTQRRLYADIGVMAVGCIASLMAFIMAVYETILHVQKEDPPPIP